ncbi:glycosyltransferase [Oenococcus sicerae]|uniref:Glycosyltransferase n=1 Tax=Oenococcus sicerae TaxID=2203724 RepID=A0AAJ1RBC1_9LACO|nr:glycosyltransferase [Oenococcus sicerae]MDN6900650.1 glycosyltransferase [Oenococcus sicerae]
MKTVNVLMSTYNGALYLKQQIDSILNQSGVDVFLTIRDDGSSDNSLDILNQYSYLKNVEIIAGENVGFKESFIALLLDLRQVNYDFYAFSDQDDYWMPQKLEKAVELIGDTQAPCLYVSDRQVADENLNLQGYNVYDKYPQYDWQASSISRIIDCRGAGCTEVWNAYGQLMLNQYRPVGIPHDEWVTAVFTFLGQVKYDSNAYILYRRHKNVVTSTSIKRKKIGKLTKLGKAFRVFHNKDLSQHIDLRSKFLLEGYTDMLTDSDKKSLTLLANYKKNLYTKFRILLSGSFRVTSRRAPLKYKIQKIMMLMTNGL